MAEMEEILEDEEELSDEEAHDDDMEEQGHDPTMHMVEQMAECQHTSLSTIQEGLSGNNTSGSTSLGAGSYFFSFGRTQYYTPRSPTLDEGEIPLLSTNSPFLPPAHRQHLSCPPLPVSHALLAALGDHAKTLNAELDRAKRVIRELEGEIEVLNSEKAAADKHQQQESQYLSKVRELEELLEERDSGQLHLPSLF